MVVNIALCRHTQWDKYICGLKYRNVDTNMCLMCHYYLIYLYNNYYISYLE